MSEFYAGLATVARNLLTKYGQAVTIRRVTGSTYDPVTGSTVDGTATDYAAQGVVKKYPQNMIDGTQILATDRQITLDDAVKPLLTDKIIVASETWTPVEVSASNPAGTPLVYFVQARR